MAVNIDPSVARATKDAIIDTFPNLKSAHLSEAIALLFGFRTWVAMKIAISSDKQYRAEFHRETAVERLEVLTGCSAETASSVVDLASATAIAENIAASKEKHRLIREAARQKAAATSATIKSRFSDLSGSLVGFVVKTKHGKFKPFIGKVIDEPEDDDALVSVVGEQPPQETVESALALFDADREKLAILLEQPVRSGGVMGNWLAVNGLSPLVRQI